MGRDKASIPSDDPGAGTTLAARTAGLLGSVCRRAVEVGPGHSALPVVDEVGPGRGPLSALVAGWNALKAGGWDGPVLVVATDLPNLTGGMLEWLAGRPGGRSVVPVANGRVQPLCARYSPTDLDRAAQLVADGERSMKALLAATEPELVHESVWAPAVGGVSVLEDVDTPEDLKRVTDR